MKRYINILKNNRASFWKRGLAYLIDLLIINFVIVFPFQSLINQNSFDFKSFNLESLFAINSKEMLITSILIVLLSLAYWSILEYKLEQSVGKILLNLKVKTKKQLSLTQSIIRNLSKPFFFILIIDIIYLNFSTTKQRLFEKWSNTWVIQE